ncbi:glycosyltransferase domain-containing protein [Microbacterium sp. M4A5_1d]
MTSPSTPQTEPAFHTSSLVVFTSLFGRYDSLLDQPVASDSQARFVCFTDDPDLTSDTWEIRVVQPAFAADPVRSARLHKILGPGNDLEYDVSLYIDASVRLKVTPEELVAAWLPDDADMALPTHSYRDNLIDEFDEVIRLNYDDRARVYEQLSDYARTLPDVLDARPHWTALLIRRRNERVAAAMRVWADHVLRYSRRDQLSVMVALDGDIDYRGVAIDNFDSRFHQWPIIEGRRVQQGKAPALPAGPLAADLRRAVRRIAELESRLIEAGGEGLDRAAGQIEELNLQIEDLKLQIEQGTQERARIELRLDNKTREAVLASERVRELEERQGTPGRLLRRLVPLRYRR